MKPATPRQQADLDLAYGMLKRARDLLKSADCPSCVDRVRWTMKSVEGAQRHMVRRVAKTKTLVAEPAKLDVSFSEAVAKTRGHLDSLYLPVTGIKEIL